jgi:hypothetical protein
MTIDAFGHHGQHLTRLPLLAKSKPNDAVAAPRFRLWPTRKRSRNELRVRLRTSVDGDQQRHSTLPTSSNHFLLRTNRAPASRGLVPLARSVPFDRPEPLVREAAAPTRRKQAGGRDEQRRPDAVEADACSTSSWDYLPVEAAATNARVTKEQLHDENCVNDVQNNHLAPLRMRPTT